MVNEGFRYQAGALARPQDHRSAASVRAGRHALGGPLPGSLLGAASGGLSG